MAKAKKEKTPIVPSIVTSITTEQLENRRIKLTIKTSPESFREGLQLAYSKNKHRFNVPGFRKGKAPRKVIEQSYGRDVFYEDAVDYNLNEVCETAFEQQGLDPAHMPKIELGESSEAEGAVVYMTVTLRPEGEISDYYGLTCPKSDTQATEDDIQNALQAEQKKNARMESVDRPAEMGDTAIINFKGYIDGVAFDGGSAEDHSLKLGSGQFIPGFEEQIVGHVVGDDIKVEVTFPEDYHSENFAGKAATFEVEILDIQATELPEINDQFADDVSEFETLAEYREDLAKKISEYKKNTADSQKSEYLLKKLHALCKVDIPEEMYAERTNDLIRDFTHSMSSRGIDLKMYMQYTGLTQELIVNDLKDQAKKDVLNMVVLESIAKKEKMTATEEELEKKACDIFGKEAEEVKEILGKMSYSRKNELKRLVITEKAMELVLEKAVETDDEQYEIDLDENIADLDEEQ
ncbi:MAG: trigger factor [Defluviitaleaceae bacterium]|nr:trigger factor [Defluviitaleaceae bacterium]